MGCPSAHADALVGEELAGTTQLAVGGEGVPLVGEVLLVDEVAESAERALALVVRPSRSAS
ncbi:hypothetical protein I1A62_22440 [Rhodococcus sp. USK10]|uniref:hypothetical protein n=1 Tax=Rhodococcus sp. USK10 TaxID=2789739 RepID=UPI001C5E0255|nr:hypothetical protein [Rhodococcus sp. USK10]QYB07040.1 hypothetical protein I1A62_22440 [Rhodococcus sp. USK10]